EPLGGVRPTPGDAFWTAARGAGVPAHRLRVVDGLPTPAFTAGWFAPRIYVARALADGPQRLAPDALTAVLAHEGAHLRRRDPLRFSALRAVAQTLFWLPALRALADGAADEAEVRADDAAAAATDPLTLAGALVALAAWRTGGHGDGLAAAYPGYAVGFVRADLLDRRVRRLAGEDTMPAARVSRRSLAGAALALSVVWAAGVVDVHALPRDTMAMSAQDGASANAAALHCFHQHASALTHLFCRWGRHGGWITTGGSDCPHRATMQRATGYRVTVTTTSVAHGVGTRVA
ncbi:MAG TPA: M56 family metallopeptidase, partial [Gemmatirosa sp.]